jgi:hypothetical protein
MPDEASSSSSTIRDPSTDEAAQHPHQEPSGNDFQRAGWTATTVPNAGAAGKGVLMSKGGAARNWDDVQVDDKHHLWSPKIKGARTAAIKVSRCPNLEIEQIHTLLDHDTSAEIMAVRKAHSSTLSSPYGYGSAYRSSGDRYTRSNRISLNSHSISSPSMTTPTRSSLHPC